MGQDAKSQNAICSSTPFVRECCSSWCCRQGRQDAPDAFYDFLFLFRLSAKSVSSSPDEKLFAVNVVTIIEHFLKTHKHSSIIRTTNCSTVPSAKMFCLRRAALRVVSSSPSSALSLTTKSRSITTFSPALLKQSRSTLGSRLQRRFVSDEIKKADDESGPPGETAALENAVDSAQVTEPIAETVTAAETTPIVEAEQGGLAEAAAQAATSTESSDSPGFSRLDQLARQSRNNQNPSQMLYIGNLFFDVTEDDLKREFSRFGEIVSAKIVLDPRGLSRGFGYLVMENVDVATRAREAQNQQVFEGRRMNVQFANELARPDSTTGKRDPVFRSLKAPNPPAKTLFIGNLAFEMSDQDLNNLFRGVRNIIDVRVAIDRRTGQPRGFAHADFIDTASATAAMDMLKGKEIFGRRLRVDYGAAKTERNQGPPEPEASQYQP